MGRGRDSRIPGNSLADRLRHKEQSDNRRKELIASLTRKRSSISVAELTPDRIQRDGAKMRAQLTETPFYYIGEELCFAPSTTYLELVDAAVRAMNSGKPEVVLCWPAQQASISAVVALAALADAASTPQRKVTTRTSTDVIADEPLGLRAVLFPYARTTHIGAREIQIDRKTLTNLHLKHLLRTLKEGESALKDYHTVLTRVGTMTGKARDGRIYPEFLHPVLDEIVPHGSARNGCATDGHLLWRTKSKTDLGALRRSGLADDARAARYFL